jgi:Asp/Glu/hydantoin racemase
MAFEQVWPEARRMNLLDDSLSVDRAQAGELMPAMTQRFVDLAMYAKGTGCSGILFTCSAFGPAIEAAGVAVGLPTLKPNEAMFEQALARGSRLGLVATFEASITSMSEELQQMAHATGRTIELRTAFVPGAMQDLALGQAQIHHDKVAAAVAGMQDCDVIMLAQFSMAGALAVAQARTGTTVLSSPDCAVLALRAKMDCGSPDRVRGRLRPQ